MRAALVRDEHGALAPLPISLPAALTPRVLPDLVAVPHTPPVGRTLRRAVVTALLIPPTARSSCNSVGGGSGSDIHPYECQVLLIERTDGGVHGGQVALPGGKAEPGETPMQTAIRELHEELGFDASDAAQGITFVGSLDAAYVPTSDYSVEVLVAIAPRVPVIVPEPSEVAGTLGAELGLFDPRLPILEVDAIERGVSLRYGVITLPGNRRAWGLTARLLCELAARCAAA